MTDDCALETLFQSALLRDGQIQTGSVSEMVGAWEDLVEASQAGYGWDLSEFDDELAVRERLEAALSDAELARHPSWAAYRQAIERADATFRELLQPGVERGPPSGKWWERGVLRRAGKEYAEDVESLYGAHVEVVDESE